MTLEQAKSLKPGTPVFVAVWTIATPPSIATGTFQKITTHVSWRNDPTKPYVEVGPHGAYHPIQRTHLTEAEARACICNLIRHDIARLQSEMDRFL